jgi:hypothetical protein
MYTSNTYLKLLKNLPDLYSTTLTWVSKICMEECKASNNIIFCNQLKFKFSIEKLSSDDIAIQVDELVNRDFLFIYLQLIQDDLNNKKEEYNIRDSLLYIRVPVIPIYLQKKIISDIKLNIITDSCIEKLISYNS